MIAHAESVDHFIIYYIYNNFLLHVHTVIFKRSIFLLMGELSVWCDSACDTLNYSIPMSGLRHLDQSAASLST